LETLGAIGVKYLVLTAAVAGLAFAGGCTSRTVSNTPRTAIEQMLLSTAVDRALAKFELPPELKGEKVYLDFSNYESVDGGYVKAATRARFNQLGAIPTTEADEAHFVAELACGGLGTEFKSTLLGVPSIPLPNAPVAMPEAPVLKTTEQTGIFKLLVFIHDRHHVVRVDHFFARADRVEHSLLWVRIKGKDDIRAEWQRVEPDVGKTD
jgi:hypothetical protein